MSEEIDAIGFDVGGTLVDLEPSVEEVHASVLTRHGCTRNIERIARAKAVADLRFDSEFAQLQTEKDKDFWRRYHQFVFDQLGCRLDIERVSADLGAELDRIIPRTESWVDYPDTRPFLEKLSERDFKLFVISNATDLAKRVLDNLDLTRHFEFVMISEEEGVKKPQKEIFMRAARRAGVSPNRVMFLGDRLSVDVIGANTAGMQAVLIDRRDVYPAAKCVRARDFHSLERFL